VKGVETEKKTMKTTKLGILAAAAALLGGCVVTSVYPFYFEKDLAFEPALLGAWQKAGQPDEHWKFERDKANGYRLTVVSEGKPSMVQGHLFKLQGQTFLDLTAAGSKEDVQPEPVPTHLLVRVERLAPKMKLAGLNYGWLSELLAADPKAVRHVVIKTGDHPEDRRIVLTADTAELQQFVLKHLKTEGAWDAVVELEAAKADPPSR
jgi:hypothetical protein